VLDVGTNDRSIANRTASATHSSTFFSALSRTVDIVSFVASKVGKDLHRYAVRNHQLISSQVDRPYRAIGSMKLMTVPIVGGEALEARTGSLVARTVDVIIAAWNRSDTIERAILSALAEPEVRHVIAVDDGSSDDTAARARQCGATDDRVIVEQLPSSLGPAAARNIALKISSAPWLTVRDFIADDLLQIHEARVGKETPTAILSDGHFEPWSLDLEQFVLGNVSRHGISRKELGFLKPLIRRSFLNDHNLRYDEALRLGEDYALYARALALRARFLIVPVKGYVSVLRDDSISARHDKRDLERFRDTDLELTARQTLTPRERRALRRHYSSVDCRVQWLAVIEAVRSHGYAQLMAAFCRSPKVSLFLMMRLCEELSRRIGKAIRT
jgi:succinoglycan biosynthesis protein ExoU